VGVVTDDDTREILRRVWARRRGDVLGRVDAIDAALAAGRDEAAREEGRRQAHMLAGSAGTFGFPEASVIARELEHALQSAVAPDDAQRAQAARLRQILEGEPQE
jgi:HPt (histidine-containing phosphotransfer) domain-containing protein